MNDDGWILTLTCTDRVGIVAGVSGFLAQHAGFILDSQQYADLETGRFFMRVVFARGGEAFPQDREALVAAFAPVASALQLDWALSAVAEKPRLVVAVSKGSHCLNDLLHRQQSGTLSARIVAVVSNHDKLRALTEWHGLPYHHLPVGEGGNVAQEQAIREVMAQADAPYLVLARYMQILTPGFTEALAGRCINIHHSFLPGFKGARPYHRAHERGVKLIGATAHFVTGDLDEGPIIEQAVERVDHRDGIDDLIRIGRDIEAQVLARAVDALGERRVFPERQPDGGISMSFETVSSNKAHGGVQGVYRHDSAVTGTPMTFSVFVPPHEAGAKLPVLWYLSGLTCTHANVTEKGEYRAACAEQGVIFIAPDTSPRGDAGPDDDGYDFGKGAGFYVDATEDPWATNFRMRSYIEDELPALILREFACADMTRQGITGHSMGGHGALTIALRNPDRFKSVSAFAPIVSPMNCPWGEKALTGYIGADREEWRAYDACAMIADGLRVPELLVDQGDADNFLAEQLKPELLAAACEATGIDLTLRMQPGYDHSYYFISTFLAEHVAWHAARLKR